MIVKKKKKKKAFFYGVTSKLSSKFYLLFYLAKQLKNFINQNLMINPYALRAYSYLFGKLLETRHLTIVMMKWSYRLLH